MVSGRDTTQLARWLPVADLYLSGNHGMEEMREGVSVLAPEVAPFLQALDEAAQELGRVAEARFPGVQLERKRAILAVHYRRAPHPQATGERLLRTLRPLADRLHLELHPSRLVWELRPPLPMDKGAVMRRLWSALRPQGIIYAGDDITDAAAFAALRELGGPPTLAVGVTSAEVDPAVFRDCDLRVEGVAGVRRFLEDLAAR